MSSIPSLRLTQQEEVASRRDGYRFERRGAIRRRISGRATALLTRRDRPQAPRRLCSVQLRDLSATGVGAVSQEPIEAGSSIVVFFPERGAQGGFDVYGEIVRCDPGDDGYHIGVRLTSPGPGRAV